MADLLVKIRPLLSHETLPDDEAVPEPLCVSSLGNTIQIFGENNDSIFGPASFDCVVNKTINAPDFEGYTDEELNLGDELSTSKISALKGNPHEKIRNSVRERISNKGSSSSSSNNANPNVSNDSKEHIIVAYGQTGAGKTYTMFGKEMAEVFSSASSTNKADHYDRVCRDIIGFSESRGKFLKTTARFGPYGIQNRSGVPIIADEESERIPRLKECGINVGSSSHPDSRYTGNNTNGKDETGLIFEVAEQLFEDQHREGNESIGTNIYEEGSTTFGIVPFRGSKDRNPPSLRISFVQIYNEKVTTIFEHQTVFDMDEVYSLVFAACNLRATRETVWNECSSRSHAILTIESPPADGRGFGK